MKITVEMEFEAFEALMTEELKRTYRSLKSDSERGHLNMYYSDKAMDKKAVQELIEALKLVHNFYSLTSKHIKD